MTETRIIPLEVHIIRHGLAALTVACAAAIGFFPIYMRPDDPRFWITPLLAVIVVYPMAFVATHILVKPWIQRRIAAANSEGFSEALSLVDRAYWITIVVAGVVGATVAFSMLRIWAHNEFSILSHLLLSHLVVVASGAIAAVITAKTLQRLIRPWARAKLDEAGITLDE